MPRPLPPSELFDLGSFSHADLFAGLKNCWEALGKPLEEYVAARLAREIRGHVALGSYLVGDDIEIGEGTVVEPGAYSQGPAIIGKHREMRHAAYVRGLVVIGDGCVIGHATEIKSAIVLDGAKAGHFAYIGDSILGNNVNLGAGTKLANFKLSGHEVVLSIDGERVRPAGDRGSGGGAAPIHARVHP